MPPGCFDLLADRGQRADECGVLGKVHAQRNMGREITLQARYALAKRWFTKCQVEGTFARQTRQIGGERGDKRVASVAGVSTPLAQRRQFAGIDDLVDSVEQWQAEISLCRRAGSRYL